MASWARGLLVLLAPADDGDIGGLLSSSRGPCSGEGVRLVLLVPPGRLGDRRRPARLLLILLLPSWTRARSSGVVFGGRASARSDGLSKLLE